MQQRQVRYLPSNSRPKICCDSPSKIPHALPYGTCARNFSSQITQTAAYRYVRIYRTGTNKASTYRIYTRYRQHKSLIVFCYQQSAILTKQFTPFFGCGTVGPVLVRYLRHHLNTEKVFFCMECSRKFTNFMINLSVDTTSQCFRTAWIRINLASQIQTWIKKVNR